MALFSERKRIAALEQREADGESLWTRVPPKEVREKIINRFRQYFEMDYRWQDDWDRTHDAVCDARGVRSLNGLSGTVEDTVSAIRNSDLDVIADLLEGAIVTLAARGEPRVVKAFQQSINEVLASHRVSIEMVDGRVIEFESKATHQQIVVPALTLFAGDARFAGAEKAYQDALREVATDEGASDAITDAATCLQELLSAIGCKGNALEPLLRDARAKGLLGPADGKLSDALGSLIDWVSADRSEKGDAHNSRPASRADAWLTIHVVGAVALRLATGGPRSGS